MHWVDYLVIGLLVIFFLFIILLTFCLLKTIFIRNKDIRILKQDRGDQELLDKHAKNLFELVNIKTTSYETGETYHIFREKVKEMFPLVHQYFNKEKLAGNAIFTYKSSSKERSKVLFVTHIDTVKEFKDAYITEDEIYGSGTFDSKALFYSLFQAVEEHLQEYKKIDFDLTIVMTVDDISTKQGNELIVNKFLKQGAFFKLVLEEGIGIIDPTFLGMKSNFALIGVGVTGEVIIRYKAKKAQGRQNLEAFIAEVHNGNLFKSKIDKESIKVLNAFAKDMPFVYRLLFSNIWLFRPIVKSIIDNDQTEISRLLKTHVLYSAYQEDDDYYFIDLTFELATHDTAAEIVGIIAPLVKQYGIEHHLVSLKDPSKMTSQHTEGYQIVKNAINNTYHDLYIAPYIITKIAEQRYLSRVSDCVIRFSPLYYPFSALHDCQEGNEYIMKKSIKFGIDFYKEILRNYR